MKKMFKKKESLNKREEELMNYLWEIKKPMTTNEMAKQLQSEGWTNITLCRTVQSLTDQGYLEVADMSCRNHFLFQLHPSPDYSIPISRIMKYMIHHNIFINFTISPK